jgi:signal transduction histidine kinase
MSAQVATIRKPVAPPLAAFLDSVPLPMCLLRPDPGGMPEFLHGNGALGPQAARLWERTCRADGDPTWLDGPRGRILRAVNASATSRLPVMVDERTERDGQAQWSRTVLTRIEDDGDVLVLAITMPASDDQAAAFETARALTDLSVRFEEFRVFATMAAHDARAPLATVASLLDLVVDDFSDLGNGKAELLHLCRDTVVEAMNQIATTLERARILHAAQGFEQDVDIGRLCADVAGLIDPEGRLDIAMPRGRVVCDPAVLQLVLRNLISNAAGFCRGRIEVHLGADASRGILVLHVADDGPGLPADFDLSRLIRSARERDGAHGFGLASIVQLTRARGGSLRIGAAGWQTDLPGAVFRLELPGRLLGAEGDMPGVAASR